MELLDIPLGLIINVNVLKLTGGVSRLILPGATPNDSALFSVSSVLSCSIRVTRGEREQEPEGCVLTAGENHERLRNQEHIDKERQTPDRVPPRGES